MFPLWFKSAACRGASPGTFYRFSPKYDEEAKQICYNCPVIDQCLVYALKHNEPGVWGGTTEKERIKMSVRARLQEVPITLLRRRNMRERGHPANEYQSYLSYMSGQRNHNQEFSGTVAALPLLIFGATCKES